MAVYASFRSRMAGLYFRPLHKAIPELASLKSDTRIEGHFSIGIDKANGMIGGVYSITSNDGAVSFQMNPQIGWSPMPGKLWMKTYFWNCDIQTEDGGLKVNSEWSRKD